MTRLIITRILISIPLLLAVATVIFLLTHVIPGDVAGTIAGPNASPATLHAIRVKLGLTQPLWQQYLTYLNSLLHGNLGTSYLSGLSVSDELFSRLPSTILLVTVGMVGATLWGLLLGALMVFSKGLGRIARFLSSLGLAMPDFVLGIALIFVFYFLLSVAPSPIGQIDLSVPRPPTVTGAALIDSFIAGDWATFGNAAAHLVLPAITLTFVYGASVAKVAEAAFREAKGASFMDYARLVGLSRSRRASYLTVSSLPSTITYSGASYAYMLGGVVLIETVFSWGGIAQFAATAIANRDLPVIQGFVLIVSVITFLIYLILDILYLIVDPRVRT
jgi:ABC-type dipeptide/oligopeptide/nickel transport system permease component